MKIKLHGQSEPPEPVMELALEASPDNATVHLVAFDHEGVKRYILTVTPVGQIRRRTDIPRSTGWPVTQEGKLMVEGWTK